MADGPTIPKLIADLKRAFPRETVVTATVEMYARELADVDPAALAVAVREIIRTGRFFPSIAELRDVAATRALGLPDEAEAVAQAERFAYAERVRVACDCGNPPDEACPCCRGQGDYWTGAPDIHPLVREALNLVGGAYGYKNADEPGVVRGQFLRLYRSLSTRAHREAAVGNLELPAGAPRLELPSP